MGLDRFTSEAEEVKIENEKYNFTPHNSETRDGVETISTLSTKVKDTVIKVDLDEQVEVDIHDENYQGELDQAAAEQLAADRVWDIFDEEAVLASNEDFDPVFDDDSTELKIIKCLARLRVATRSHIEQELDFTPTYHYYQKLKDKHMISHISNDGNAHVLTVTPRGYKEILSRNDYDDVRYETEDDSEESEEGGDDIPEDVKKQQTLQG